jgi:hypothetical protein
VWGYIRALGYDIKSTVVVAASPRGGSTWLAELMASRPQTQILWEPLHLGNNPDCRKHGFGWQNYIPKGAKWEKQKRYLHRVLTGRDLSTRLLTSLQLNPRELLSPKVTYVAKFVNANMILPHMVEAFGVPAIHMIRHPCAVVSSQIEHGSWSHLEKSNLTIPDGLFSDYPHLASVFERIEAHEELLAFEWAVQNYVSLSYPAPLPWYLTTYERMVMEGPKEIQRISQFLGVSLDKAVENMKDPSATASGDTTGSYRQRLTKWKDRLQPNQADRVLRVAHDVGITCYTEDPTPDDMKLPRHSGTSL